jgi:hypothetical protein
MSGTTTNYNLKKPLGSENYNVLDQNGNMDIIDAQIKTVAANAIPLSQKGVVGGVAAYDAVATSLADMSSQVSGKGASLIGLNDIDSLFTSTNVEGALKEVFTNANNGKIAVANSVNAKGISAIGTDTFAVLATKIDTPSLVNTADANATAGGMLIGKSAYINGDKIIGTIPNGFNQELPWTVNTNAPNFIVPDGNYIGRTCWIKDVNLVASNIKSGINIFGLAGSFNPSNIKSIQRGTLLVNDSSTTFYIPISAVDLSISIVDISFTAPNSNAQEDNWQCNLSDSTNIYMKRDRGTALAVDISWTVIEFNNVKSKQTGWVDVVSNVRVSTISAVNPLKCMLWASHRATGSASAYYALFKEVTSATSLTFKMYGASDPSVRWQLIEFN